MSGSAFDQLSCWLNRLLSILPDDLIPEEEAAVRAKVQSLQQEIRLLQVQAESLDEAGYKPVC